MKFIILNEKGDETLVVAPSRVATEFQKQKEKGRYAVNPKTGEDYKTVEEIPDTVEELLFGKLEHRGEHGN